VIIIPDYKASHQGSHTISSNILTVILQLGILCVQSQTSPFKVLVDKVTLGQFFSYKLSSPISIIPLLLHVHSFIYQQHYITSETERIIKFIHSFIYFVFCKSVQGLNNLKDIELVIFLIIYL